MPDLERRVARIVWVLLGRPADAKVGTRRLFLALAVVGLIAAVVFGTIAVTNPDAYGTGVITFCSLVVGVGSLRQYMRARKDHGDEPGPP